MSRIKGSARSSNRIQRKSNPHALRRNSRKHALELVVSTVNDNRVRDEVALVAVKSRLKVVANTFMQRVAKVNNSVNAEKPRQEPPRKELGPVVRQALERSQSTRASP